MILVVSGRFQSGLQDVLSKLHFIVNILVDFFKAIYVKKFFDEFLFGFVNNKF